MNKALFIFILFFTSNAAFAAENESVIWSEDKTALAFCEFKKESVCFVICNNVPVNVSLAEKGNIGKLGSNNVYENIITFPLKWESSDKGGCLFWFRTLAWLDGQRYTVEEPVYVRDGKYMQR